jgi:hypothetical protein
MSKPFSIPCQTISCPPLSARPEIEKLSASVVVPRVAENSNIFKSFTVERLADLFNNVPEPDKRKIIHE